MFRPHPENVWCAGKVKLVAHIINNDSSVAVIEVMREKLSMSG